MKIDIRNLPTFIITTNDEKGYNRLSKLVKELKDYGFKRVFVHYGLFPHEIKNLNTKIPAGASACCESHISLMEFQREFMKGEHFLILEDDSLLVGDKFILEDVPEDFDFIRLGGSWHFKDPLQINDKYLKEIYTFNAHAILYKTSNVDTVLKSMYVRNEPFDFDVAKSVESGKIKAYSLINELFWQRNDDTDGVITILSNMTERFDSLRKSGMLEKIIVKNTLKINYTND